MKALALQALLPFLYPLLASALTALVAWLAKEAVAYLRAHTKTVALAAVADACADALEAAVASAGAGAGKPPADLLKTAEAAAKARLLAEWPTIELALHQELDALLPFKVAEAGKVIATPGGASVQLPTPGETKGLALIVLLVGGVIIAGGAIVALLAIPKTRTVAKACLDRYVAQQLPAIEPRVYALLSSGQPDWEGALEALAKAEGTVVSCAIQAIVNNGGKPPYAAPPAGFALPDFEVVKFRGAAWLTKHPLE